MDGMIISNTSVSRNGLVKPLSEPIEGGLSGQPIFKQATDCLRLVKRYADESLFLIAAGGITDAEKALEKFKAGAHLIQLYTGLIYKGPEFIQQCVKKYLQG